VTRGRSIRRPRNLDQYQSADHAIRALEGLARDLRERMRPGDMLRWNITISHWNDEWLKPSAPAKGDTA
jgi:hypothetical protein